MGELLRRTAALDAAFHMHTYARKPVHVRAGEGMRLYDDDGREYLDFVVRHRRREPRPRASRGRRCGRGSRCGTLVHVSNLYYVEHRDELAERPRRRSAASAAKVVLLQLGRRGERGCDQARAPVGQGTARRRLLRHRHRRAVVPRPHDGGARGHRSAEQAGGVRAAAGRASRTCR